MQDLKAQPLQKQLLVFVLEVKPAFRTIAVRWTAHSWEIKIQEVRPHICLQRRYSVAKIDSPIGYEGGKPKAGGLSDPRLGTMDRGQKCTTDGASSQDSPGYFGHIELAKPVFHIGFISTIVKVLRCVSYHSSKLLVGPVSCLMRVQLDTVLRVKKWF